MGRIGNDAENKRAKRPCGCIAPAAREGPDAVIDVKVPSHGQVAPEPPIPPRHPTRARWADALGLRRDRRGALPHLWLRL